MDLALGFLRWVGYLAVGALAGAALLVAALAWLLNRPIEDEAAPSTLSRRTLGR